VRAKAGYESPSEHGEKRHQGAEEGGIDKEKRISIARVRLQNEKGREFRKHTGG